MFLVLQDPTIPFVSPDIFSFDPGDDDDTSGEDQDGSGD